MSLPVAGERPQRARVPGRGPVASFRFELGLAHRLLRSARRDAQVNLLAAVAALGLGLGVMALVIVLSALSGFQSLLIQDARSSSPDLLVIPQTSAGRARWSELLGGVRGVESQQQLLSGRVWLMVGGDARTLTLVGVERDLPRWLAQVAGPVTAAATTLGGAGSSGELPPLWLPERLGRVWSLPPGAVVELVSPRSTLSPLGPVPRRRAFRVAGWHQNPLEESAEERVAVPLDAARSLLGEADWRIDVVAARGVPAQELKQRVAAAAAVAGLRGELLTWRDLNRGLLFVLRMEKAAVFLGVVLIVLVASFALAAVVSILVAVKGRDFGLLAAIGLAPERLRRTLLLVGALLGASGGLLGAFVGLAVATLADRFELLPLPGDVYVIDHVPFLVRGGDVLVVVLAAVVVTFAAAEFSSRKARWIEPRAALQR